MPRTRVALEVIPSFFRLNDLYHATRAEWHSPIWINVNIGLMPALIFRPAIMTYVTMRRGCAASNPCPYFSIFNARSSISSRSWPQKNSPDGNTKLGAPNTFAASASCVYCS